METFKHNPETGEWAKETWLFDYDALGRRISKGRLKNGGQVSDGLEDVTEFIWSGSRLVQEVYGSGRYTYIHSDQDSYEPLAQIHNYTNTDGESRQEINYFHCDQIGIPREMTDRDGNLIWFGEYDAWGKLSKETNVTGRAHQPFRLQNQYCDRETGLHYNFFRYYDPDTGRFINQDPIGLAGGENFYNFAVNSQSWIDPLGLMKFKLSFSRVGNFKIGGRMSILKHILTRHRLSSKFDDVSRFNTDSVRRIKKIIKQGHEQQIGVCNTSKVATFDKNIGTDRNGNPTNKLQLHYDSNGFLRTAFPI